MPNWTRIQIDIDRPVAEIISQIVMTSSAVFDKKFREDQRGYADAMRQVAATIDDFTDTTNIQPEK